MPKKFSLNKSLHPQGRPDGKPCQATCLSRDTAAYMTQDTQQNDVVTQAFHSTNPKRPQNPKELDISVASDMRSLFMHNVEHHRCWPSKGTGAQQRLLSTKQNITQRYAHTE